MKASPRLPGYSPRELRLAHPEYCRNGLLRHLFILCCFIYRVSKQHFHTNSKNKNILNSHIFEEIAAVVGPVSFPAWLRYQ
eukprot:3003472-Amphidinium_carterae.1